MILMQTIVFFYCKSSIIINTILIIFKMLFKILMLPVFQDPIPRGDLFRGISLKIQFFELSHKNLPREPGKCMAEAENYIYTSSFQNSNGGLRQ